MAQIIQTICDLCQLDGEQEAAEPLQISDGEVDICKRHLDVTTLGEMLDAISQGYIEPRPLTPTKPKAAAEGERIVCNIPGCSRQRRPLKSLQGLRIHMTRNHPEEPTP